MFLCYNFKLIDAGWSSLVARWAHNPKVEGSNPSPATKFSKWPCGGVAQVVRAHGSYPCCPGFESLLRYHLINMIFKNFQENQSTFKLVKKNDKILIGLSGGPDSAALLFCLNKIKEKFNLELFGISINYHLRGIDSDLDLKAAKSLSKKYNIKFFDFKLNPSELKLLKKGNIQDNARNFRFNIFLKAMEELGIEKLALGHNLDDRVETIIMNILRGCSPRGLIGLEPISNFPWKKSFKIIRPLLTSTKSEILEFCSNKKIPFRIDKSNLDTKYLRNRIRNNLIPYIDENYKIDLKKNLAFISELLYNHYKFFDKIIGEKFKQLLNSHSESFIELSIKDLRKNTPYIRSLIYLTAIERLQGTRLGIYSNHLNRIDELIQSRKGTVQINLPNDIVIEKSYNNLRFGFYWEFESSTGVVSELRIFNTGDYKYLNYKISIKLIQKSKVRYSKNSEYFSAAILKYPLLIRTRCPGDKIIPFHRKRPVKVKKLLIDLKIEKRSRDMIPLIFSDSGELIYILGIKRSNFAAIDEKSKEVVKISFKKYR